MARAAKRLTARAVATIGRPGLHADGDGLYLRVDAGGSKRWALLFQWQGKRTEMGLGRLSDVSLADARGRAADARKLVAQGRNPIEVRNAERAAAEQVIPTFGEEADDYIDAHASEFRNAKHVAQWRMTLGDAYCANLRPRRIDQVSTEDILGVLQPIWTEKPETASRLRGRIERVLDAAAAKKRRSIENPARWRGHLKNLLAKPQKLNRGHHAAMPYRDVPEFMARLRGSTGTGAAALRFTVLTVSRTSEVTGARDDEFDLVKAVWTVPGERMKSGREHRVPLTAEAVAIVRAQIEVSTSSYVFAGAKPRRPISNMTMSKVLRAAGAWDFTVHGFRSSFRDWVGDETSCPDQLAEATLAHVVGDETERAYRRGDALAKRRKLMEAWANYCAEEGANNIVPLKRSKRPFQSAD